jgi:hypothetical protein
MKNKHKKIEMHVLIVEDEAGIVFCNKEEELQVSSAADGVCI